MYVSQGPMPATEAMPPVASKMVQLENATKDLRSLRDSLRGINARIRGTRPETGAVEQAKEPQLTLTILCDKIQGLANECLVEVAEITAHLG